MVNGWYTQHEPNVSSTRLNRGVHHSTQILGTPRLHSLLQSYPACWTAGPGAWGVCSSSARLRPGWKCRTAGLWCTGCPSGQRQLLWGSSGTCAPPAPVTPWGKRTWIAHERGRRTMSVRVTMFPDRKGHQRTLSGVTTQNLSCSEIGTSCKKERSQRIKIHQYLLFISWGRRRRKWTSVSQWRPGRAPTGQRWRRPSGTRRRWLRPVGTKNIKIKQMLSHKEKEGFFHSSNFRWKDSPRAQSPGAKLGNFLGRKAALAPNGSLEINTFVNCHLCGQVALWIVYCQLNMDDINQI